MKLIAKKPCSFGGEKFYIGDEIPVEYVLDPVAQERLGVLAIVKVDDAEGGQGGDHECPPQPIVISDPMLTICVHVNGEDVELEPTDSGLQDIFNVLIGPAEAAAAIIKEMDDEDALILLHMADSRKSVKNAAEARAKAIRESEGEQ